MDFSVLFFASPKFSLKPPSGGFFSALFCAVNLIEK
jgi:hypothetical protein